MGRSRSTIDIDYKTQHPQKVLLYLVGYENRCVLWIVEIELNSHYQQQLIDLNRDLNVHNSSQKTQSNFVAQQCSTLHVAKVKMLLTLHGNFYYTLRIFTRLCFFRLISMHGFFISFVDNMKKYKEITK